jgi:serine/threonine protein kinase
VHRDIKPSNVIVGERGGRNDVAKLLDFGLVAAAKIGPGATPSSGRLTQPGILVGTPEFMSPEQCADADSGPASDIYSLGALAYYLLTGRSPFAGRSPVQMLAAHLYESAKPMREHGVAVPEALEAVVRRCLAKAAEERFASVSALSAALDECAHDYPWTQDDARRWWAAVEPFR